MAQKKGTDFTQDIFEHPRVVSNMKIREFFEKYKLIENADVLQSRFEFQIKKMAQLIELHKNFMKSNEVGQTILKFQRDIFRRKIEKNYTILVQLLIECHDYIESCCQGGG